MEFQNGIGRVSFHMSLCIRVLNDMKKCPYRTVTGIPLLADEKKRANLERGARKPFVNTSYGYGTEWRSLYNRAGSYAIEKL